MWITGVEPGVSRVPIVIFSLDRPDYLERLCRGLLAQVQVRPDPSRVFLMQDGAVSPRSGRRYGDAARMQRCVHVFRSLFPHGTVVPAGDNLGIADNILRGQRHVFEALDEPLGYFFEDDLEPGPLYLAALEAMRAATEPFAARVAHFSAIGDHLAPRPGPVVTVKQLEYHWGFGLRREAWRRIQDHLAPWWEEVRRVDYRGNNHLRLLKVYRGWDAAFLGVGQDSATAVACASLRLARLNTDVSFARYIGEHGEHFTPGLFRRRGFEAMRWAEAEAFTLLPIAPDTLDGIVAWAREFYVTYRRDHLEPLIAKIEAEQADPDRIATEEDIAGLWLLMLDRRTVPPQVLERHVNRTTMRDLRREIVRMRAFQRVTGS
ncbi:hypothetical protein [Neoroseomonas lacus]|uniref:Glycosyltransferase n=1 Tax=Neoroseomonas lacus TaxID=287609 RepID=A0A917K3Z1_9PROT|nr:hypothetical protein [Neoroseomonas lacus]GGI99222.1 hypothetical protein GCM10011320_02420 [Neoroseomonas lacus]